MYPSYIAVDADIIIIGAGISGMSAAFYILEKEPTLTIIILEANQRIGGRTYSIPLKIAKENNFRSFDLGGQFILPSQVHLINLIQKLELQLVKPLDTKGKTIWNLKKFKITTLDLLTLLSKLELLKFFDTIYQIGKTVSFNNPHSIQNSYKLDIESMEDFIKKNLKSTSAQNFARHVIKISCGAEPSQVSVLYYLAFCNATDGIENQFLLDNSERTWIQGGADLLCQKLASLIGTQYIMKGDPVIEIIRENHQVFIKTENTSYISNYVIVSIPPREVLDIKFTPPLNHTRVNVLQNMNCGHLIRFVVTYKTAFWKSKGFNGDVISCGKDGGYGPVNVCYDITYNNSPALVGLISSSDCTEQPADSYQKDVLQQLAEYFGNEALTPIDYFEKDWLEEPYIQYCVMSSPDLSSMDTFHEIRRPVGRLYWAGTETATHWNGYMSGAVQAGYRAAMEVLYESRPQVLTHEDIQFIYFRQKKKRKLIQALINYGSSWKFILTTVVLFGIIVYKKKAIL